jgi:hypothetical protein
MMMLDSALSVAAELQTSLNSDQAYPLNVTVLEALVDRAIASYEALRLGGRLTGHEELVDKRKALRAIEDLGEQRYDRLCEDYKDVFGYSFDPRNDCVKDVSTRKKLLHSACSCFAKLLMATRGYV